MIEKCIIIIDAMHIITYVPLYILYILNYSNRYIKKTDINIRISVIIKTMCSVLFSYGLIIYI